MTGRADLFFQLVITIATTAAVPPHVFREISFFVTLQFQQ
jgi:hypothetical protein